MAYYTDDYENEPGVDAHAARELFLFAENDGDLYRMQMVPIQKNLVTKFARGTYDSNKAVKLWMYFVDNAARKYEYESGTRQPNRHWMQYQVSMTIFNKPTRIAVAKAFRDMFEEENKLHNYDMYLPKKYQKKKIGRSCGRLRGIGTFNNNAIG